MNNLGDLLFLRNKNIANFIVKIYIYIDLDRDAKNVT